MSRPANASQSRRRQINSFGLETLYAAERSPSQGRSIFVAIHGLAGDSILTWTDYSTRCCWLRDLLPTKFPDFDVLTFGHRSTIGAAASTLMGDLIAYLAKTGSSGPNNIIFIGHGDGGTVAKQVYLTSSPTRTSRKEAQSLHGAIKGFVFFGTRHRGSFDERLLSFSKWGTRFGRLSSWAGNAYIPPKWADFFSQYKRINIDFEHDGGESLPMVCFYETVKTAYIGILVSKEDATIELAWVENKPGNGRYGQIAKLNNDSSLEAERVWSAIRNIIKQMKGEADTIAPGLQPQLVPNLIVHDDLYNNDADTEPGLKVLALGMYYLKISSILPLKEFQANRKFEIPDGGGIRGLFAIIVLQNIMEEVRKLDSPGDPESPRPCDYFDLIGGTSTGGLLAVMLGRLRMDLVSCKLAYKSLSSIIFKKPSRSIPGKRYVDALRGAAWYSGDILESVIRELVVERITMQERATIIASQNDPSEASMKSSFAKSKTFVCAIVDKSGGTCERIRTYESAHAGPGASCSIWEACRATSAASIYFPSITINGRSYWDGGMNSNNPILQVMEEARSEFGEARKFQAVVSIGTGKAPKSDPSSHALGVAKYAIKRMTDTEEKHTDFINRFPDKHGEYFRFNEEDEMHHIDLADWKKLGKVEKLANDYVASVVGQREIKKCARKLSRTHGTG